MNGLYLIRVQQVCYQCLRATGYVDYPQYLVFSLSSARLLPDNRAETISLTPPKAIQTQDCGELNRDDMTHLPKACSMNLDP